jgi:uncharacterized protein YjbI with pentapeptide repeats
VNGAVIAASIAAAATIISLIGTLIAQVYYRKKSSDDTKASFKQQNEQLKQTLAAQSTRTRNERFATAADLLGSDTPAIQLAGVYAMATLADDWEENRQTCVDVLCAYLRLPYEPEDDQATEEKQREFQANSEVRHTLMRVIAEHLRDPGVAKQRAPESWQGLNFNFSGVVFDGGSFSRARFSGAKVDSGGRVDFGRAEFSGGKVAFHDVIFSGGRVTFHHARFCGGTVEFDDASFSGGNVEFDEASFSGGKVDFSRAEFSPGSKVSFELAQFSGSEVNFDDARFSGGAVDFSSVDMWSRPPAFSFTGTPPPGVQLPEGWTPC